MVNATCSALHCSSSSHTHKDVKFHQFPHDAERRKLWISACKRSDVIDKEFEFFKHKYVCSLHFQKCMYSKKDRLKKSAVPSLNLAAKPLQHDSSTQTVESIHYVRPGRNIQDSDVVDENDKSQNDVSISYVMANVEKSSTTTFTQTEDNLSYDIHHVNIKEEIITHKKIEETEPVEHGVEIKTENDNVDDNRDLKECKEDEKIKIEINLNNTLPHAQFTQSLDFKNMGDSGTLYTETKKTLQEKDQGKLSTTVDRTECSVSGSTNSINTTGKMPIMKTKINASIQTHRVIVLSQKAHKKRRSLNPGECRCKKNRYEDLTRVQFYRSCSKFLSANFCAIVRKQMYLDDLSKKVEEDLIEPGSSNIAGAEAKCVDESGEVVAADVVARTETADSCESD